MRLAFTFLAAIGVISCAKGPPPPHEVAGPYDSVVTATASRPFEELTATDSAYVAGGVSTFAGIHGIRQNIKIPLPPACDSTARVYCFEDTTRAADECCTGNDVSNWLVLLASPDSLEFFVVPGAGVSRREAGMSLEVVGPTEPFQEHDINTAPYLRYQFPAPGTYTLYVGVPRVYPATSAPYQLRVADDPRQARRAMSAPLIQLPGDTTTRYFLRRNRDRGTTTHADSLFLVRAGWYRVLAPGVDTIYACGGDCRDIRAIPIRPDHS